MTARLPDSALRPTRAPSTPDAPALIAGDVMHRRTRPVANAFSYPAFCLRLPLSGLARLAEGGIALNARGLVSFHERDHGPRDGSSLDAWIRALLAREGDVAMIVGVSDLAGIPQGAQIALETDGRGKPSRLFQIQLEGTPGGFFGRGDHDCQRGQRDSECICFVHGFNPLTCRLPLAEEPFSANRTRGRIQ